MAAGQGVDPHDSGTSVGAHEIASPVEVPGSQPAGPQDDAEDERRIDGPEGAPLVVVHADLSCPDCALAIERLSVLPVRLDLRHFVVRSRGVSARRAALAAEAAAAQAPSAFWPFARALLADQGRHDPPHLWAVAGGLGLDVDRFDADRRAEVGSDRVARETRQAITGGATGIPAVFVHARTREFLRLSGYDAEVRLTTDSARSARG